MELRHLRYFVAVAEELSFTRAARNLNIAQPPLSQQIRDLEGQLGVSLFLRTHHHVELTAAGRQFLRDARDILLRADDAVTTVRRAAQGEEGELRLGFVSTAMYSDAVPQMVRDFRSRHPAVALHLEQLSTVQQVQALVSGRIDAGFLRPPVAEPRLVLRTVVREALLLALPLGHPLARRRRVKLRSAAEERWVMISREMGAGYFQQTFELCLEAGFTPRVSMEVGEIQTVVGLVAAGFGVALVPASITALQHRGAVYVPLSSPRGSVEICVAYLRNPHSPVFQHFLRRVTVAGRPNGLPHVAQAVSPASFKLECVTGGPAT
jgi:DNA-binding transcriptional LysR family regulator